MNLNTILVLVPINLLNRFSLCMNKIKYDVKNFKGKERYMKIKRILKYQQCKGLVNILQFFFINLSIAEKSLSLVL